MLQFLYMGRLRRLIPYCLVGVLIVFVFIIASLNRADPDMFFHLASGRVIAEHGIVDYDALSQAGPTRHWTPIEWLFDLGLYRFVYVFGFPSYGIFMGLLSTLQVAALLFLFRRVLRFGLNISVVSSLLYVLLVYTFLIARPHL